MRESINRVEGFVSGPQHYTACEPVYSFHVEFLHADGTVGMVCDNFVASPRVLSADVNSWIEKGVGYRFVGTGKPHFQRSQFPCFFTNMLLRKQYEEQAEARKVIEQYMGWKTVCTAAAAAEPLFG